MVKMFIDPWYDGKNGGFCKVVGYTERVKLQDVGPKFIAQTTALRSKKMSP